MRILLANYRYFISGGPERYMFNVKTNLESTGHEIIPFSIHYTNNRPSTYSQYFVEPLGGRDEVFFRQQRMSSKTTIRTISRLFYARDVERAVTKLAKKTKPQIAYVLHYLRKLSPSLLVGLKKAGLPIVVRLSDYAMLCPQAHCIRDRSPCQLCAQGNLYPSIQHSCLQNSSVASLLNALATWYHRAMGFFDLIDKFVVTNEYMYEMMLNAGYPKSRLECIPTFVDETDFHPTPDFSKSNYFVFSGRLEPIKGIEVLLNAFSLLRIKRPDLGFQLKVAGFGESRFLEQLKSKCKSLGLNDFVHFMGNLSTEDLSTLLGGALFSVVPSLWYENLPNTILESYACGTPVLAPDIGSLTGCVNHGETGFLFQPNNHRDLAKCLGKSLYNPDRMLCMGQKARTVALEKYSARNHLRSLEKLLLELVQKKA